MVKDAVATHGLIEMALLRETGKRIIMRIRIFIP
jgi:hypothetical protein